MGQDRLTLAFKLRASPAAVINLHPDLPLDVKSGLDPRCSRPVIGKDDITISSWAVLLASLPCNVPSATAHNRHDMTARACCTDVLHRYNPTLHLLNCNIICKGQCVH